MLSLTDDSFLGIMFMAGACILFLAVFIPSWFKGNPRRFWVARLTYKNEPDQQQMSRFFWVLAWLLATVGALVSTLNLPQKTSEFWWVLGQTLYFVFALWLIAKIVMAAFIAIQYICFGFIRLKRWIFDDKPLFHKAKNK